MQGSSKAFSSPPGKPKVALFATCLVDLMRPQIGWASLILLEKAGCVVEVPQSQTCCGQPAFNSGDANHARSLAKNIITAFESFDYVVAPSGSCAGMIKIHYPELFEASTIWRSRAEALAKKTYELLSFLIDIRSYRPKGVTFEGSATYHDSCSGLRELGVLDQPRKLLAEINGLCLESLTGHDVCCGFGGTFCVKYPSISNAVVEEKAIEIEKTEADVLLGGDLGCLLNIAGKLNRRGSPIRVFHTAEVIAGMTDRAIGEER